MKFNKNKLVQPCESCGAVEGEWRDGGEVVVVGDTVEDCFRKSEELAGYFCATCWSEVVNED